MGKVIPYYLIIVISLFLIGSVSATTTVSDNAINTTGNLTIGEKITFSLGEIIDNIVDGWVRVTGNLNVTGNLSVEGNVYTEKLSPPTSSESDVLLLGQGALTPVFTDTGASIFSHDAPTSTSIVFTKTYSEGEIDKNDIVVITNASDPENNGVTFVVGRYPPDDNNQTIQISGAFTIGGTADITIYSGASAIDKYGRAKFSARLGQVAGGDDVDRAYNFGYMHDLDEVDGVNMYGIQIDDYNLGTDATRDFPLSIYRYDYIGSKIFYVNGQGDTYTYGNLEADGDLNIGDDIVVGDDLTVGDDILGGGILNITGNIIGGGTLNIGNNFDQIADIAGQLHLRSINTNTGGFGSTGACTADTGESCVEIYALGADRGKTAPNYDNSGVLKAGSNLDYGLNIYTKSTSANADIRFYTNPSSYRLDLILKRDGNVGINTTTPQNTLNVVGDLNVTSVTTLENLKGSYGDGSAYVCVYDNGTLFASDSACP